MSEIIGPNGEKITSNGSEAGEEFIHGYARILQASKEEEAKWIYELRAQGICGAHPDDGHVDRKNNLVTLMYPQFMDKCTGQGDRIALGWPWKWRIVKLQEEVPLKFKMPEYDVKRFRFEEVKEE